MKTAVFKAARQAVRIPKNSTESEEVEIRRKGRSLILGQEAVVGGFIDPASRVHR